MLYTCILGHKDLLWQCSCCYATDLGFLAERLHVHPCFYTIFIPREGEGKVLDFG
jgi:hypothetical protein